MGEHEAAVRLQAGVGAGQFEDAKDAGGFGKDDGCRWIAWADAGSGWSRGGRCRGCGRCRLNLHSRGVVVLMRSVTRSSRCCLARARRSGGGGGWRLSRPSGRSVTRQPASASWAKTVAGDGHMSTSSGWSSGGHGWVPSSRFLRDLRDLRFPSPQHESRWWTTVLCTGEKTADPANPADPGGRAKASSW